MTDLFYYDLPNQVKVRANKAKVDELWVKDEETGDYAKVVPGGGGTLELPYWVKATKAEFENSSLNNAGLIVNGVDKTAVVSSTGVSLTDGAFTEELTATDLPILKQLGTREEVTSPPVNSKVPIWNSSLSKYQVTPWRNYLGTDRIAFTDGVNYNSKFDQYLLSLNDTLPNVQGTTLIMRPSTIHMGTRLANATGVNYSYTRVMITPSFIGVLNNNNTNSAYFSGNTIGITKNSNPTNLTWETLNELNTFVGKTELTTPTAVEKMVLFDPVTKGYRYSAIPASTVLPSWVQSSQAAFENLAEGDTRGTYVDSEKILLRPHIANPSPTTGDTMTITRSGITAGRYGTDTNKTVLTKSQIDFYNGSSTPTSLTKFDVDKLKPTKFTVTSSNHLPKVLDDLSAASLIPCPVLDLKPGCEVYIDVMGGPYLSYSQWHAIKINNTGLDAIYEMEVVACYNTNYHAPNVSTPVLTRLEDKYNIPRVIWHRTGNAIGSFPAATLIFKLGNTNGSFSSGQSFQGVIKLKYVGNGVSTLPAVGTI